MLFGEELIRERSEARDGGKLRRGFSAERGGLLSCSNR
jgi:hypothetical protein